MDRSDSKFITLLVLLVHCVIFSRSSETNYLQGTVTTITELIDQVYEPHTLQKSKYAADGANSFLLVDSSGLFVMNSGYSLTLLAGHPGIPDYEDGSALNARFNHIGDLAQSSDGKTVYIVDEQNHCVRRLNRDPKEVDTFAGNCTESGFETGRQFTARFRYPSGITIAPDDAALFLCDTQNDRVLKISLRSEAVWVSTIIDHTNLNVDVQVAFPISIAITKNARYLYVTSEHGIIRLDDYLYTNISTHSVYNKALSTQSIRLIKNDQILVTSDYKENRILFYDLVNHGIAQICSGEEGTTKDPRSNTTISPTINDGASRTCKLNSPQGIGTVSDDEIIMTESSGKIKKAKYALTDLTTTTTTTTTQSTTTANTTTPQSTTTAASTTTSTTTTTPSTTSERQVISTEKSQSSSDSLALGVSLGIIIPAVLIAILIGFICFVVRSRAKANREAMYARRTQMGGYTGPGQVDEQFHNALDHARNSGMGYSTPPPHYSSAESENTGFMTPSNI